ncbi:MAG: type II secretion system F family protein [Candidatus Hydrogenedentota bacterium]
MPKFAYKAVNRDGKETFGILEAESQALAINDIRNLGLHPTQIRPARKSDEKKARSDKRGLSEFYIGGVKTKQVVIMTRQLATLIGAGMALLRSLNILIAQLNPCKLRDILREVVTDVQTGSTLHEALAKHPQVFDRLYVNMVRAGETGGTLEEVLARLADFMERRQTLKRRVRKALIYPISVLVFATGIVLGILMFVVPTFAEVFADFDAELPAPTLLLIDVGDFVLYRWWIGLLIVNSTIIAIKLIGKSQYIKIGRDYAVLKMWMVGSLVTKISVARFARTLGTLIRSGVPILESLRITKETIGNAAIENAVQKVHDSIKEGDTIARPLDEAKVFPAMVVNMIDVGEETGSLDQMLMKVADIYDAEVEEAVDAMLQLLEPILIIGLGIIIGFIVISLYLPIFSLADQMAV